MIVYQVSRRFFIDKAGAETYRKTLKLKPEATVKHSIQFREELAALLTSLSEPASAAGSTPDFVPEFLKKDHPEPEDNDPFA